MTGYLNQGLHAITKTNGDSTLVVLRAALGLMILPHGAQKVLGWFGGGGLGPTIDFFQAALGLPASIALAVSLLEFFGGIALLVGLFGRLAALGIGAIMIGAVVTSHLQYGFFMNWSGVQGGEGWEFHLLAVAIAATVALRGSGLASVDLLIHRRLDGHELTSGWTPHLRAEDAGSEERVAAQGQG